MPPMPVLTAALFLVGVALAAAELDTSDFLRDGAGEHLPPLPQFTNGTAGAHFSGVFRNSPTDGDVATGVVLQRAPESALPQLPVSLETRQVPESARACSCYSSSRVLLQQP